VGWFSKNCLNMSHLELPDFAISFIFATHCMAVSSSSTVLVINLAKRAYSPT